MYAFPPSPIPPLSHPEAETRKLPPWQLTIGLEPRYRPTPLIPFLRFCVGSLALLHAWRPLVWLNVPVDRDALERTFEEWKPPSSPIASIDATRSAEKGRMVSAEHVVVTCTV